MDIFSRVGLGQLCGNMGVLGGTFAFFGLLLTAKFYSFDYIFHILGGRGEEKKCGKFIIFIIVFIL